ncbi:hypothetical protein [Paracraurococcus ruber]|uniref:DUF3078 domain-containing protein n=1 Tax=Paracraurococcus ruber TaxID=77675 RepID=A0ABS1D293_9PROT|nr:hypothetical protein [Paracraurococcus ruber]MBK1660793.1 hypothetical protein [Paracraurococcus ruber]TDG32772.1 hypothetical protein E2C05_06020 [Paracraurococcus ruber]
MPCSTALLIGRRIGRRIGQPAALLALALALPPDRPAETQSRRQARATRAASVASRQARTDALAPPEDPAAGIGLAPGMAPPPGAPRPPEFSADLLLPFLWNTDAEQAIRGRPSPELTPEARLTWTRRLEAQPIRLSALLDASSDRFMRAQDADADLLYGRLRAQYESGQDDQEWQPFASYVPTYSFAPTYARRVDTWHDVALGASRSWNWDAALRRLPPGPDTDSAAAWSVNVNGALQRRQRDGGPPSFAALLNPSVTWTLSAAWSTSLELDVTRRWFDRFEGRRRADWLLTPILTVEFQPPEGWLPAIGAPVLDLQVFLTRQASSAPEGRFHQWGAGPILRTAWKF